MSRADLKHTLPECQAHTGRKNQVILREAGKRVAQVPVTVGDLPAQPVLELRSRGGIELEAVIAGVGQIGKQAELLDDRGAVAQLGIESFPGVSLAALSRECRDGRLRGRGSPKTVETLVGWPLMLLEALVRVASLRSW